MEFIAGLEQSPTHENIPIYQMLRFTKLPCVLHRDKRSQRTSRDKIHWNLPLSIQKAFGSGRSTLGAVVRIHSCPCTVVGTRREALNFPLLGFGVVCGEVF